MKLRIIVEAMSVADAREALAGRGIDIVKIARRDAETVTVWAIVPDTASLDLIEQVWSWETTGASSC